MRHHSQWFQDPTPQGQGYIMVAARPASFLTSSPTVFAEARFLDGGGECFEAADGTESKPTPQSPELTMGSFDWEQ